MDNGQNAHWTRDVKNWIGLGGIVLFVIFTFLMWDAAEATEANLWDRRLGLFGAIEAIGLAAFGFFFGHKVQKTSTDKAENDAQQAREEADKGKNLAASILTITGEPGSDQVGLLSDSSDPNAKRIQQQLQSALNRYNS